jgi:hypothetical protein
MSPLPKQREGNLKMINRKVDHLIDAARSEAFAGSMEPERAAQVRQELAYQSEELKRYIRLLVISVYENKS